MGEGELPRVHTFSSALKNFDCELGCNGVSEMCRRASKNRKPALP